MKKIYISLIILITFISLLGISYSFSVYQPETPRAELPVLITSCGQSPGATMFKVFFMKLKFECKPKAYEVNMLASAEDLKSQEESGFPYKSLIIVMGSSLKGMGAAGISIDNELDRIAELIEEAHRQSITIIGAHIEGMKRRAQGASVGDNTDELSIDAVAPNSDFLIINKNGNTDGRFTSISNAKNISMIEVEKNLDLLTKIENIFKN